MRENDEARRISGLIGGGLLLLVGALFILHNAGVLRAGRLGDYWPLFLVWIGLSRMAGPRRARRFASGLTIFLVGVAFQLDRLGLIEWRLRELWPFLLVVAGAGLIADSLLARKRAGSDAGPVQPHI
jgi:hypothetical protein